MALCFTHVVMSGGGLSALSYFGALRFLEIEGLTSSVRHIAGTSMGAIFAAAFALRMPMATIEQRFLDLMADGSTNQLPLLDIVTYLQRLGLDDVKRFIEVLRPEADKMTFLELSKKTGINLIICATHLATMEAAYFGVDTTPHVLVMDAVRASAAIPWVFTPVRIGEELYVDGGVSNNVPVDVFHGVPQSNILVFHTAPKTIKMNDNNPYKQPLAYTVSVLSRCLMQAHGISLYKSAYPHYLLFDNSPMPFLLVEFLPDGLKIKVTREDLDNCIAYGYNVAFSALRKFIREET